MQTRRLAPTGSFLDQSLIFARAATNPCPAPEFGERGQLRPAARFVLGQSMRKRVADMGAQTNCLGGVPRT